MSGILCYSSQIICSIFFASLRMFERAHQCTQGNQWQQRASVSMYPFISPYIQQTLQYIYIVKRWRHLVASLCADTKCHVQKQQQTEYTIGQLFFNCKLCEALQICRKLLIRGKFILMNYSDTNIDNETFNSNRLQLLIECY